MLSLTRVLCTSRIAIFGCSLLCALPVAEAQVTSVPDVVVDAQLGFHLTASGSPIALANPAGVAVAADGTVYVADSSNSRIVRIATRGEINEDPITNPAKIGGTASFLIPPAGLSNPNAVAVGPDGTLYFSDAVKRVLYRVTNPASSDPVYSQLDYSAAQQPSALAVDPQGNLWVADAGLKEIIQFSPNAVSPSSRASVSPMVPTGIAVSASAVYFSDANTNAIYGGGNGTPLLTGFAGTKFDFAADHAAFHPTGLGLDGAGNLYVLDARSRRLIEFNPSKTSAAFLVPISGMDSPAGMAIGASGNLYLTDRGHQELSEFIYNGNAINFGAVPRGKNSSTVPLNYSFNAATRTTRFYQSMQGGKTRSFVFDDSGCLAAPIRPGYTCQQQFHVRYGSRTPGLHQGVVALSNDAGDVFGAITSFGQTPVGIIAFYPGTLAYLSQTSPNPALLEPQSAVVTGTSSDLFIADEGGQQIGNTITYNGAVWDYPQPTGTAKEIGGGVLVAPTALALNAAGDLYIADFNLGAIYIAKASNRTVLTPLTIPVPPATPNPIKLYHPIALAFDPSGNLFIGDTGSSSSPSSTSPGFVVEVPVGGGYASLVPTTVAGAPVIFPQALTTDTSGNLYIADAGDGQTNFGDLVVYNASTKTVSAISTGQYTLSEPAGLAFDPALNLYVLDGYNNRLLTIPVSLTSGSPVFGTASLLPQALPTATASSLALWPGGQQLTVTDIGTSLVTPVTQVITIQTKTASLSFGPIPRGTSQSASVTALNVGNATATIAELSEFGSDQVAFPVPTNVCPGGIPAQQECAISFTYNPDQLGTTTGGFNFGTNGATTISNVVNLTGTSSKYLPTVVLTIPNPTTTYPSSLYGSVLVTGTAGPSPTGTVSVYDGSTLVQVIPLYNGYGTFGPPYGTLPAGTYTLTAVYSGDGVYSTATSQPVTVTISPDAVNFTVSCYSNNNYYFGGNYYCTAYISAGVAVTGNVVFTSDGVANTVPISNGQAAFTVTDPQPGAHTMSVSFAQQGNFLAAGPIAENYTIAQAQSQLQLTPSSYYTPVGQPLTLTAAIVSYNPPNAPNAGTVTFTDNGTFLATVNVVNGSAALTFKPAVAGSHTYVATFSGTSQFTGAANSATVTVH